MLGLRDTWTLAVTKLRTRRIRLTVTVVVAGALFSVLIITSLVIRGITGSLASFTQEGYLNRFLVVTSGTGMVADSEERLRDQTIIDRAMAIHNDTVVRKTAEAKRQGVPYDPASEPKPYMTIDSIKDRNGRPVKQLDAAQPAAQQAIAELGSDGGYADKIKAAAKKAHAVGVYPNFSFMTFGGGAGAYEMAPIINNKEQTVDSNLQGPPDPIQNFGQSLGTFDNAMMEPLQLEGTSLDAKPGDPIPILAPFDAAEKVLGIPALPGKATAAQKIAHIGEVRQKAANFVFDVCYRNTAAVQLRGDAKTQADTIAAHAKDAGFVMPSVVYGTPAEPCQPTPVTKDTRPAEEKQAEEKLATFNRQFGIAAPVTQKIRFRIVGLLPKSGYMSSAADLQSFFDSFLSMYYGYGWVMSHQAALLNPLLNPTMTDKASALIRGSNNYVELPDRASQKVFMDAVSCTAQNDGRDCMKFGSIFAMPFGNPIAALYDADKQIRGFLTWLLGIIAALSALVMAGTVGKVVADSRKETSVFRALGAKRIAVAQIYLAYTACLGALAFAAALGIGLAVAWYVDASVSPQMSATAVLSFNARDLHKAFHVVGWSWLDIAGVAGLVIATALASAVIPLAANMRRNPVKDMREE